MTALPITITNLSKLFGDVLAVDQATLAIEPGELFFLLGPSGCGKTTLLRCVAGFYTPDTGTIKIDTRDITSLPPHKRDTGMVFQSYALWPHMTVAENVAFGLKMRKLPRQQINARVESALKLVHLAERAQARPNQLSGGQQQRVALARALVTEPQCLLLDEPLSNLDAKLRLEMRVEIRRICKEAGITAIYVTHDQKEALSVADRMAIMRGGKIEQIGTPHAVYRNPGNRFVAAFIGEGNFINGRIVADTGKIMHVETAAGVLHTQPPERTFQAGSEVTLCMRPEAIRFDTPPAASRNVFTGQHLHSVYLGEIAQHSIAIMAGESQLEWKASEINPVGTTVRPNSQLTCWVAPENIVVLPAD